ncbi:MAG: YicC family protein [Candidatus Methylomirabilis sp.]|nr:YicC family protein [Deltaproteobacteria bacterium]
MRSMTGFGRGEAEAPRGRVVVEIKTVNSRFLDLGIKTPRELFALEDRIGAEIKGRLTRGKVDCYVRLESAPEGGAPKVVVNRALLRAVEAAAKDMERDFGVAGKLDVNALIGMKDMLIAAPEEFDAEREWKPLRKAVLQALDAVDAMRRAEGEALARELRTRVQTIERLAAEVAKHKTAIQAAFLERLRARLAKLAEGVEPDRARLEQELILYADRSDVTEEIVRLRSHIAQFRKAVSRKEPSGRKIEFILQEMNREVNTIGSKGSDAPVSPLVVQMKEDLEKLREQAANVE